MVATKCGYAILNKIVGKERGLIGMTYSINWDLETIFPGGSDSVQLKERMSQLEEEIKTYREKVDAWAPNATDNATKFLAQSIRDFHNVAALSMPCFQRMSTTAKPKS